MPKSGKLKLRNGERERETLEMGNIDIGKDEISESKFFSPNASCQLSDFRMSVFQLSDFLMSAFALYAW
jgi:hypothetical protein